jgi:RNA polymerase-binding transcription factor DksA
MATKKPVPEVRKKSVPSAKKGEKSIPKNAAKTAATKTVVKAAPEQKTTSKKPAAKEVAKAVAKAPKKAVTTTPAKNLAKAGKTIQKPSDTVKEKTTTPTGAAKKEEAPVKKKATAPKPEEPVTKKAEQPKAVKVPKTSATGKVPYEPDFTHSVLDTPKEEAQQGPPSTRYSDSDLGEFKTLIQRKLDAAKKELAYLQGLITRKDEMGGDNDDGRYMTMEDGSLSMEREQLSQMASRQITFIDHLEKAIMRIENKTYGICRVTGKLIDKARLRAVPHATLSMEAKTSKTRVM